VRKSETVAVDFKNRRRDDDDAGTSLGDRLVASSYLVRNEARPLPFAGPASTLGP
jgi:hypothetical protein